MITSPDNPKLKTIRHLADVRHRRRTGLFVAEGEDLVDAARGDGVEPVELLVARETVDAELLAEVSVAVFRVAYRRWLDGGTERELAAIIRETLAGLGGLFAHTAPGPRDLSAARAGAAARRSDR